VTFLTLLIYLAEPLSEMGKFGNQRCDQDPRPVIRQLGSMGSNQKREQRSRVFDTRKVIREIDIDAV